MFATMAIGAQMASLASNDAAFAAIQNSQARTDLVLGASALSFGNGISRDVFMREQALDARRLQDNLAYRYYSAMYDALQARLDKNIKKSFSYFA